MFAHQGCCGLGAKKRSGEVDGEHPVPVLIGGFQKRGEHGYARIVDERIEPAEMSADLVDRGPHRSGVGAVTIKRRRMVGIGDRRNRAVQQFALGIKQRHAPAFGQEPFCSRKPDAARRSRDQRDFLRKKGHIPSSFETCRVPQCEHDPEKACPTLGQRSGYRFSGKIMLKQ